MVKEILLVDDASTMEHLGHKLDEFVNNIDKVRLIRQTSRQGVVRTRMTGIRYYS